mmetsp:Transcript_2167/g.5058  ORF Transcript_2167/g.5058 Transcript_2167/m.5058 type:complete len:504 (-) Transcript_2167:745-2256(-)|eukprot:CAMPEP_0178999882 /NCGR_PEP_ID=MMETSP0795-20121207/10347_1 /TAXON_ID=88552 /ORGANISM="Amoebophrya sp., Strain Ameob2" /LENGTH=503 /DNA_ID=CAMNT_0020692785 /DNA_START=167 /DNA_END=1678 /DNA_ORIENTATION=-
MGCAGSKGGGGAAVPGEEKREKKVGQFRAEDFFLESKGKIHDSYNFEEKKLGQGTYGSVVRATHKATGQIRAVKCIPKSSKQMKNMERFKMEIQLMKSMDHPNVVNLFETYEDRRNIYLVMELCQGGELFDRIIECGHFTERQCAMLMRQILAILHYMHEAGIMHRDIKPENFLLKEDGEAIEKSTVKIIDFGLSTRFKPGEFKSTKAGTPYYVSPQVLAGKYDQSCDVWSCGVIMYIMLCGYPPFYGENDIDVLARVRLATFTFVQADWKNVTTDATELITKMLKKNPADRLTAKQALDHVWISQMAPKSQAISLSGNLVGPLTAFRNGNKLKKAALTVIATQIPDDSIKNLRELFFQLDVDNDGTLTVEEITTGLAKAGLQDNQEQLSDLIKQIDSDGSGKIDYSEFLAATMDKRHYMKESACYAAFKVFDRDGNGVIDKQELADVLADGDLRSVVSQDIINGILQDADANGDGEIDFEEFMAMMQKDSGDAGGGLQIKKD